MSYIPAMPDHRDRHYRIYDYPRNQPFGVHVKQKSGYNNFRHSYNIRNPPSYHHNHHQHVVHGIRNMFPVIFPCMVSSPASQTRAGILRFVPNLCNTLNCFSLNVDHIWDFKFLRYNTGCGGTLVESKPFDRRVVGSNPALAATRVVQKNFLWDSFEAFYFLCYHWLQNIWEKISCIYDFIWYCRIDIEISEIECINFDVVVVYLRPCHFPVFRTQTSYESACVPEYSHNRHRNLGISRAPLKSQAHQGTSLITSTVTNQMGCPTGSSW